MCPSPRGTVSRVSHIPGEWLPCESPATQPMGAGGGGRRGAGVWAPHMPVTMPRAMWRSTQRTFWAGDIRPKTRVASSSPPAAKTRARDVVVGGHARVATVQAHGAGRLGGGGRVVLVRKEWSRT